MSFSVDFINRSKSILLIWSPKVACTTLHKWFVEDICDINENRDARLVAHDRNLYKYNESYEEFKDFEAYFFVREPIRRCISAYLNKFVVHDGKRILNINQLESFSKELILNYNPSLLENYQGISFNTYLEAIKHCININKIDDHFNKQVNIKKFDNLKKNCKLHLINIDNLNEELPKINLKYNVKPKNYEQLNKTKYENDSIYMDITNILSNDLSLNQISINNFYYSFKTIYNLYESDFMLLNDIL